MKLVRPLAGAPSVAFASLAESLWQAGHTDPAWPRDFVLHSEWTAWLTRMAAAETLGLGAARLIVREDETCQGFVSRNRVDARFLPAGVTAAECGTYLLSAARGTGLNERVKRAWLNEIFSDPQTDCCVFLVAKDNERAARALYRLGYPLMRCAPATPAATGAVTGEYASLARRRSWEEGRAHDVFILTRRAFSSSSAATE